jgi:hypothetical protein
VFRKKIDESYQAYQKINQELKSDKINDGNFNDYVGLIDEFKKNDPQKYLTYVLQKKILFVISISAKKQLTVELLKVRWEIIQGYFVNLTTSHFFYQESQEEKSHIMRAYNDLFNLIMEKTAEENVQSAFARLELS